MKQSDPTPAPISDAITAGLDQAAERAQGLSPAITTGFRDLDFATGGFEPGALITVGARPRVGKTGFALALAHRAATNGHPVLVFSLEVGRAQIGRRLLAAAADIPYMVLRRPRSMAELDAHRSRIVRATSSLQALPIAVVDHRVDVATLDRVTRSWVKPGPVPLVVIDYLQLLREPHDRRSESRQRIVAEQSATLKELANATGAVVIVCAQLNRQSEYREGNRPQLSDLRESGAIEQDSDAVALLHRPGLYSNKADPQLLEIHLPKQREAESGIAIKLRYDTTTQAIADWGPKGQRKLAAIDGGAGG